MSSTPLPCAIEVVEGPGGDVLYRMPRPPVGLSRFAGLVPIAFGVFIASWPIQGIWFFLSTGHPPQGSQFWFAVLSPLTCFGPICFPLGGFLMFRGLLTLAGHAEIAVRAGRLCAADRCGPLRWTRRRPLHELRGFRVTYGPAFPAAVTSVLRTAVGEPTALLADFHKGPTLTVCRNYPRDWLTALATDLARRCLGEADAVPFVEPVPVAEVAQDPTVIQERPRQPTNSTALMVPRPDGVTILIPAAGILRGSSWFSVTWGFGWIGMTVLFSAIFLPAAFMGQVTWEDSGQPMSPWLACLFMSPFLLVAVGAFLVLRHNGRRRAVFTVTGDTLEVENVGLLVERRRWRAIDLKDVRVVCETKSDGDGGTTHTIELCIEPKEEPAYRLLGYRPKSELEWIATVVRQALRAGPGRPAETGIVAANDPAANVPTQAIQPPPTAGG
jgi:hypothetical protein